jgi:hypothetical protein
MWTCKRFNTKWIRGFFLVNLSHESLENFYRVNFQLLQHHNYSLFEIENMVPWEREIYLIMLMDHLKEQEQQMQQQSG